VTKYSSWQHKWWWWWWWWWCVEICSKIK